MIVGHERAQQVLGTWEWQVVLLLGPESVGKYTLARHVISAQLADRHSVSLCEHLTSDGAREIQHWLLRAPMSGKHSYVLIDLDGASSQACNQLLKILEEPPDYARFVLVSSTGTLPTIASRATVLRCGLLTTAQVEEVLALRGMSADAARRAAPLGGGRVGPALQAAHDGPAKARVSRALRALAARDQPGLSTALREWDDAAHELLGMWAAELACGRWRVFDKNFAPGLGPAHARQIMARLGQCGQASASLAAAAALLPLCVPR